MYEIKEGRRKLNGTEVTTFERKIEDTCILNVEAGTNGFQGGDTGYGCRTYIKIWDDGGTDIRVKSLRDGNNTDGVEITLGGDAELRSIIKALKFATKVLEDQANGLYD